MFDAFFDYVVLREIGNAKRLSRSLDTYTRFFIELERLCGGTDDISIETVFHATVRTKQNRNDLVRNYLVEAGYLSGQTNRAWDNLREIHRTSEAVSATRGRWYEGLVADFHAHLLGLQKRNRSKGFLGDNPRPAERSVFGYVSAAVRWLQFLDESGHRSMSSVTQDALNSYLEVKPGYRDSLRVLIRYATQQKLSFAKLKIPTVKQRQFLKYYIGEERSHELIKRWLGATGNETKYALVCLLGILYAQPVRRVIEIELTDVGLQGDGSIKISMKNYELHVDARLRPLLDRHLDERKISNNRERAWKSAYLFPSKLSGNHLPYCSVASYLKSLGISYRNLYTTALVNAFSHGLRLPKVAVQGLGVTLPTAIEYARVADERVSAELALSGMLE